MMHATRRQGRGMTDAHHESAYKHRFAGSAALALAVPLILQAGILGAEPNTGKSTARSPKCQSEYEQCAKNCDKTQIDIDNQIKQCKDKCARDTDMYCSRTLTSGGTKAVPTAPVGNLQNAPVVTAPNTSNPKGPTTGGTNKK